MQPDIIPPNIIPPTRSRRLCRLPFSRFGAMLLSGLPLVLGGCGGGGSGGGPSVPGLASARVVFQSDRDGGIPQIYLMNGDGTGQVRITSDPAAALQPSFNRDGSLIAFRARRAADASNEIYVMDADGKNPRAITQDAFDDAQPAFSPLSNKIVFKSSRNGQTDLYSFDLNSGAEAQLTNDQAFDGDPAFMPDGRVIFSSNPTGPFLLYVLDSGGAHVLPHEANESQFFPDVSRAGRIAFVSNGDGNFEIYVMNEDGSGRLRLTNNSVPDVDPVFSPDGSHIYFAALVNGNYDLYVVKADGSEQPRRLTTNAGADRLPDVR